MSAGASATQTDAFTARLIDWATLYRRGFFETAQASLDELGGSESKDPRVVFLSASTQLRRLRYEDARKSLEQARALLEQHPEMARLLPNTVFAKLPQAIQVLAAALEEGLMPALRGSPVDFLKSPSQDALRLTGHSGGGLGVD